MPAELFKVIANFTDAQGRPLSGTEYKVALLDKDRFFDDRLGSSGLNANGEAEFLVASADILSFDSRGERTPDLYFVLRKDGAEVFRSAVYDQVDFETKDAVTGRSKALTQTFGPFAVDA